jgi:hypothetical protein
VVVDLFQDLVNLGLEVAVVGYFSLPEVRADFKFHPFPPGFREDINGSRCHTGEMSGVAAGVRSGCYYDYKVDNSEGNCRYSYRYREEEDKDDKVREKDCTGGKDTEYCAGGAYHRQRGEEIDGDEEQIEQGAHRATAEIKDEKPFTAPVSLECRTQKIQAEHIKENVPDVAVEKLVCDEAPDLQSHSKGGRVQGAPREKKISNRHYDYRQQEYGYINNKEALDNKRRFRESDAHLGSASEPMLKVFASIVSVVKAHIIALSKNV